ncbi:MAG: hypothetical protein H6736_17705 [Alphaproteobacteria bacterium]|nr:hypothetical protein [Alphaproteobacteria bacterium]
MLILAAVTAHADPLPDLLASKTRASCSRPAAASGGNPHPGAEQLYAGSFRIDEAGVVSGQELRFLYANEAWKALPGLREGKDCKDVWTVVGRKVPAQNCPTCAFGIEVQVDIDTQATTCVRRLTPDDNHFSTVYGIVENADGTVEIRFKSGKPLGKGRKDGDAWAWTSDQTCTWF